MTWEPTGLGREWMKDRYCHEGEDSWVEVAGRVGHVVGQNQRDQHRHQPGWVRPWWPHPHQRWSPEGVHAQLLRRPDRRLP
jgi:hypothetical protein